jgi:hypothetical protein
MNGYLALGMHRAGARVNILPTFLDPRGCPEELLALCARSSARIDGPVVYASWQGDDLRCFARTELFLRAMYEASRRLPPGGWPSAVTRRRG